MTVTFRRAVADDIEAIARLLTDDELGATREGRDLDPYRRAFDAINADPAQLLIVADDDSVVAGTLQLTLIPGLARGGALRGQIEAVRVARDYRARGLGSELVEWAIEQARLSGCGLVQLTTDKTRADAHRFYERLGFVASHEGYKLAL